MAEAEVPGFDVVVPTTGRPSRTLPAETGDGFVAMAVGEPAL
jgi:hypothetical protein